MKVLAPSAALLGVLLLAGCGGSDEPGPLAGATPKASPVTTPAGDPTCAPAEGSALRWPKGVPAELPVPPTAKLASAETTPDGLTLVRFSTQQSVRDGVVFLVKSLQPAGFVLGRGDAEAAEADVPFSRGQVRGLLKMVRDQPCRTQWVLALQSAAAPPPAPGSQLLPRVTTASPSPLPFG